MSEIGRRVRSAVNPVSTAATRWWCQSGMRRVVTGYGPTAEQRRLIREMRRGAGPTPDPEQMKERAAAIDQLLGQDDHR
jgi:hypothetical protein